MQRITFYVSVALSILVVGTLFFSLPYIASAIFFYEGEMSLDRALEAQGIDRSTWDIHTALAAGAPLSGAAAAQASQAVGHLQRAVGLDKNNAEAYHSLADAYVLQGDFKDAAETVATFERFQPLSRDDAILLGTLYARAGDTQKVVETWRRTGVAIGDDPAQWTVGASQRLPVSAFSWGNQGVTKLENVDQKQVVVIYRTDTIGRPLLFPEGGEYRVKVRALHSLPPPVQLDIQIDQATVDSLYYGAGDQTWGEQETRVRLTPGAHWLGIKFANDYYSAPYDRNAYVEWVEISRVS